MTGQVNLIKLKAPVTPVSEPGTPLVQEGPLLLGDVHARLPQSAHLHHQHHLHHHHQLLCTEIEKEKVTFQQSYLERCNVVKMNSPYLQALQGSHAKPFDEDKVLDRPDRNTPKFTKSKLLRDKNKLCSSNLGIPDENATS